MVSSEVQRTLVKSPPELWAELSDPAALARHLGELGEIHITRTEPETTVEWIGENISGTVSIKPSGWGTKVTLTVSREAAPEEPRDEPEAAPEPVVSPVAETEETEPEAQPAPGPVLDVAQEAEPESESAPTPVVAADVEPQPSRGFFARLFGRRRRTKWLTPSELAPEPTLALEPELAPEPESAHEPDSASEPEPQRPDAFAAVRQALAPESFQSAHPFAVVPASSTQVVDRAEAISAELIAAEEVAAEEVTAVLTAVLDRLGAAHHRPFSRA